MKRYPEFERMLADLPSHFSRGAKLGRPKAPASAPKGVVVCGMGGSALPGLILEAMASSGNLGVPVIVWRNYDLPRIMPPQSLVICLSYSGNTEETISSFLRARRKRLPILAITTGGKLAEAARKYRVPLVLIPAGLPPRLAIGYLTGAVLGALKLDRIGGGITGQKLMPASRVSKNIARLLTAKIPLIYSPPEWQTLAHIWKIAFNENAKIPAFSYAFPEINHNEMMGLASRPLPANKTLAAIFLADSASHPRIRRRIKLTQAILRRRAKIKTLEVKLSGRSFFEKLIYGIELGYWSSYWLAVGRGVNPFDEKLIEDFKKEMGSPKATP